MGTDVYLSFKINSSISPRTIYFKNFTSNLGFFKSRSRMWSSLKLTEYEFLIEIRILASFVRDKTSVQSSYSPKCRKFFRCHLLRIQIDQSFFASTQPTGRYRANLSPHETNPALIWGEEDISDTGQFLSS